MRTSFTSAEARKLWRETMRRYELMVHEKLILRGACVSLDRIALLEEALGC